jgi:predicted nucleic acid-binding Zn ribbon protein
MARHGAGDYQMLWDCRFCGTKKLLGVTHRHCPNCGAAQDPAWRYFPAEEDMVALENHQYVGADKICPACSQPNSAASTYCSECGADLATGKQAESQGVRELGTGGAESDTRRDVVKDQFVAEMARVDALEAAKPIFLGLRKKEWIVGGAISTVVLLIVAAVFAFTYRKDVSGTVQALTWQRSIDIESFAQHTDASWDDNVPGDAYSVSCSTRQHGTKKVANGSHQECRDVDKGDGSFSRECKTVTDYREEPVYDQWCAYTVDRWGKNRAVTAQGDVAQTPYWPQYALAPGGGSKRYGQERAGDKHETYTVVIRQSDGKKTHECAYPDQSTWARYSPGMEVALRVGIAGGAHCDTLKPK